MKKFLSRKAKILSIVLGMAMICGLLSATPFSLVASAHTGIAVANRSDITYSGNWQALNTNLFGHYCPPNGSVMYSNTAGDTVSYTFPGENITMLCAVGYDMGIAAVYIDDPICTGAPDKLVDLSGMEMDGQNVWAGDQSSPPDNGSNLQSLNVYTKTGLTNDWHTITVRVTGSHNNVYSRNNYVCIYSFQVRSTDLALTDNPAGKVWTGFNNVSDNNYSVIDANWNPYSLIDGNYYPVAGSYGWSSVAFGTPTPGEVFAQVDLDARNYINKVVLYSTGICFPLQFRIDICSVVTDPTTGQAKSTWKTVYQTDPNVDYTPPGLDSSGKPMPQVFTFPAQTAEHVRVTATKLALSPLEGVYRMQLSEIGIFYDDPVTSVNTNVEPVAAPNQTYYISSKTGNDSNDGVSPATAWKTLAKASQIEYQAGNVICLERGDTWNNDSLQLLGDGTKENPIEVTSYGDPNVSPPAINAGYKDFGIFIQDHHGYKIHGIDFTGGTAGIYVETDCTYNHDYLEIFNCNFQNLKAVNTIQVDADQKPYMAYRTLYFGAAIAMATLRDSDNKGVPAYSDISIHDVNIDQCDSGILIFPRDYPFALDGFDSSSWYAARNNFNNVTIKDCNITRTRLSGGLFFYGVTNGDIDNVFISDTGADPGFWFGIAACQISYSENVMIENCEFCRTHLNPCDGEGIDFESGNKDCTVRNTYIHDNQGPAIMCFGHNGGWRLTNSNITIENCDLYRNGDPNAAAEYYRLAVLNWSGYNTGVMQNNRIILSYPGELVQGPNYDALTLSNNQIYSDPNTLLGAWTDENGVVQQTLPYNNYSSYCYVTGNTIGQASQNIDLTVKIKIDKGSSDPSIPGWAGINFMKADTNTQAVTTGYIAFIREGGQVDLYDATRNILIPGSITGLDPLASSVDLRVKTESAGSGLRIEVYANGQLIIDYTDTNPLSGSYYGMSTFNAATTFTSE